MTDQQIESDVDADGLNVREVSELNRLLLEQGLYTLDDDTNPNYRFLFESFTNQEYDLRGVLKKGFAGVVMEGSSRSGKTWSSIDFIIYLCLFVEKGCKINIYRDTFSSFSDTLYDDFKRRLDDFDLPNPFHTAKIVKSFKIGNNTISFKGCDKLGKHHGAGADYVFFNEMMHIERDVFDQATMRLRAFWWGDYNPSVTQHWVFDKVITKSDVGFLRTTFRQNPFISNSERNKILSYEPWRPGSYKVMDDGIYYKGKPIDAKNNPPPHPTNQTEGTADEFMWKVYGLGLRGAMRGVIFKGVKYIDEFPDVAYTYGMDFGFTADPTALVRYAEDDENIWLELLMYQPTETPDIIIDYMTELGIEKDIPIVCDSSDKYTGENKGTVEMVKSIKRSGYKTSKVKKKKGVMYWILSMKNKKIYIVKNNLYKFAQREQENYRLKEVHGIAINQPIDKWNHFWDASRYGHISHNVISTEYNSTKSLADMGVNY